MDYEQLLVNVDDILRKLNKNGCTNINFIKEEPAPLSDVEEIEHELNISLPLSFRETITKFARKFHFSYNFPETLELPIDLKQCSCGMFDWSLDNLVDLEQERASWVDICFSDESDEYDIVWHKKLAFCNVGNGDMLSISLDCKDEIVYLSHDGDDLHGAKLANDFNDFLFKSASICFVGNEIWQLAPFLDTDGIVGIQPNSRNAEMIRDILLC